jgi:hypothetical protein
MELAPPVPRVVTWLVQHFTASSRKFSARKNAQEGKKDHNL